MQTIAMQPVEGGELLAVEGGALVNLPNISLPNVNVNVGVVLKNQVIAGNFQFGGPGSDLSIVGVQL